MHGEFNGFIAFASSKQHNELQKVQTTKIINELAPRTGKNQIDTLQCPVTSLLTMYNATSTVLENLKNTAPNYSQRGDAHNAYNKLRSFEFIFILHLMKEVLGIIDNLCQALQRRSQDILNAMSLILTIKDSIQNRNKKEDVIVKHHYRIDLSYIDSSKFNCIYKTCFFAMKIVKTRLRSKMEDDFLKNSLVVYIKTKKLHKNFM
uniref:Uncharacterized protein n=1 Tax=Gossypium raimondii TaxID=29730 RepID=A0A0D2PX73_GOSRA|nr:hypothetical protein B456_001G108100 [Gossypium raimondii]